MTELITGAMGTLLPKLGELLTKEYKLQKGVRGEIMFLKAEMESMQAALLKVSDAPIDQPPDNQVKIWAKAVRDLSYDLEDSIDRYMVRVDTHEPHSFMGYVHRSLNLLTKGKIRHKIGVDIKGIKSRIKEISEQRDRYKIDNIGSKPIGPTVDSLRLSALYDNAADLIGIEEKSEVLLQMLKDGGELSEKQLKMVSIAGFGGLGKTTLANVVYQKLKPQFDCCAFVSVSLTPNMKKIFENLLNQLDKKNMNIGKDNWDQEQLIRELREFLQNKRYLIVIDDMWDKTAWKIVKRALIENEYGSRVLATTRNLDIAKEVGHVYQLESLSIVDSRKLFYQRIFGGEEKGIPLQLDQIATSILKKCGGIPLAIVTIASLLASKEGNTNAYEYWSMVYQSMGSGLQNSLDDLRNMMRILSVSYYDLPPHLKTCLLYLSLYPEDYKIETTILIWKWVGEGFVKKEHGKNPYKVGEHYLVELINRSLLQPAYIDSNKIVTSCRVHDMVRDLITSFSNDENFLTRLGDQQLVSVPSKFRRLSLQTSNGEVIQLPTESLSHVRSLTVANSAFSLLPTLSGFLVLRALDFSGCREVDDDHLKDICNLFHLRYLRLHQTSVKKIPREIGNLRFLEVLDMSDTELKEELPSTFVRLTQLVLLDMPKGIICAVPRLIPSLSSLSFLRIAVETLGEEDLQVLGSMPSLSDLDIWVNDPRKGRDGRLIIDNGYRFRCLTKLSIGGRTDDMELVFTQGAMQQLRTLKLCFRVRDIMRQYGGLGLENLSSLEHVCVQTISQDMAEDNAVSSAILKSLNMNPNKPTLEVKNILSELILQLKDIIKDLSKLSPQMQNELSLPAWLRHEHSGF
ncbi:disease resistance protein RGA5-like isoform X1 [Lolium rigidum]|uniref:disease resistance protein RGA5-like isoform X1 n=1 Tax=Lolium rigidum TaxID=89674 RepID=UPI001F5D7FAE|nr:disease resistance protein RGA5-like isoform X1 [Lolium rigidum]XP_047082506.1 disease resistance protein RGA5-like isoform X1 [Lolium rigidum]